MATPVVVSRIQNRRGTQDQFNDLYPLGYNGIGGYGSLPGFDSTNYPNVLLPGELALVTDARRTFIGNINGEYIELADNSGGADLLPIVISLPPAAVFTTIPGLSYMPATASPFISILYDLTDDPAVDWNTPGTDFSRNGTLQITSVKYVAAPPAATLTDIGTEINNASPSTITFIAEYDVTQTFIEIKYMHDFSGNLTFSSSSRLWQPI